ncbi:YggT family protein [Peptococcus simiae]|uniref:YggT family protein n=1 Tax=Peptococcus simiae TaxID=1643805 RepID=A0ABW9H0X0_9FIRM
MTIGSVLYDAVNLACRLYQFLIIVRAFMTWLPIDPYSRVVTFVSDLTDPFFRLIERFMPGFLLSPLNFTPMVAYVLVALVRLAFNQVFLHLLYGVSAL